MVLIDLAVIATVAWAGMSWANRTRRRPDPRLAELERPRPVRGESVAAALPAVNDVVERGLKALDALDRKAALIPPAIGIAAGIAIPRVEPGQLDRAITASAGLSAIATGLIALAAAVIVMVPRSYRAGVDPVSAALGTGDDPTGFMQGLTNSAARSAVSVRNLILRKSDLFIVAVVALAATILLTTVFGVNGGFDNGAP